MISSKFLSYVQAVVVASKFVQTQVLEFKFDFWGSLFSLFLSQKLNGEKKKKSRNSFEE